jgi:hypothetical protein
MRKTALRWIINASVLITLLILCFLPVDKAHPIAWIPYGIFALANWLFADLLFSYTPPPFTIKSRKLAVQPIMDLIYATIITAIIFNFSSRFLFDDAGFVLRYVENFKQGYFYHYNQGDPPVFGLSGFIYGCICFAFSMLGISSTASLKLANLVGSIAYLFVLLQICRYLISDKRLVWLVFILLALGLDSVVLMFASGLELPVHIAIVLATILFYLKNNQRLFLFFAALSIVSKLDAAPIMAVLFALYVWEQVVNTQQIKHIVPVLLFAGVPLIIWIIGSYLLFGSPLPQSAFAKYHFHPNPDKHSFPFFFYFNQHPIRKVAILIFEGLAVLHLLEMLYRRKITQVKPFIFGFMFIAIMVMYYYYNPNERMIWYYSLPYFLLMAQVVFSSVYWLSKGVLKRFPILAAIPLLVVSVPVFQNVNNALTYQNFYTERVERERFMIGNYLGNLSTPQDTLMSSHGLVGWKYKGYVMDLSGLNSKLVTNYKRNVDSLIHDYKPDYIINHAWPIDLNIYGKYGFGIDTIFADVTLLDYPYWAIMKRVPSKKRGYAKLPLANCHHMYDVLDQTQVVRFYSDSLYIDLKDIPGTIPKLWTGIKREENSFTLEVSLWSDSTKMATHNILIEKGDPVYVSKYVKGVSIPLEANGIKATAITIVPKGIYSFTCLGPILEFIYE